MTPEVRAIADRFILDTANVKYLAANLPEGALDRRVEGLDWSVRQAFGHFVVWLEGYVEALPAMIRNELPAGEFDVASFNSNGAEQTANTPIPEMVARLDTALSQLLKLLTQMPKAAGDQPLGSGTLTDLLRHWSLHMSEHSIDLVDTLPELRFDPMILNWVLYVDYSNDPRRFERQEALMADVREHYVDDDEDEDDDDS
ncbi:MAG: DinB family protein [Tepidiformaceae bacterium]